MPSSDSGTGTEPIQPLKGLKVLDLSTTLPGPLATLMLAEAGAKVIKIERRDGGDPGRANRPQIDGESLQFAMLNRGKRSIALDLKKPGELNSVVELVKEADILVEQFRPGVMDRLGLGYEALSHINSGLIYCSITGYGQSGPLAARAGHDLNYLARNGVLSLGGGVKGEPVLPPALIADIGGGTYPAVINILLAVIERQVTGKGCHLDIAMAEQVFPWISRQLAILAADGAPPLPGRSSHTGGTPRYGLYRTSDEKYLAVAAIEDKFWCDFCDTIGLPETLCQPDAELETVKAAIAKRVGAQSAWYWRGIFAERDCCVEVVADLDEALVDPQFVERALFTRRLLMGNGEAFAALPVSLDRAFLSPEPAGAPSLGELELRPDLWNDL